MKKRKTAVLFLILGVLLLLVTGCVPGGGSDDGPTVHRVLLSADEGYEVDGETVEDAEAGDSVCFHVSLKFGYIFKSVDGAEYNESAGTVILSEVEKPTRITLTSEYVGYDTSVKYFFKVEDGGTAYTSSVTSGSFVQAASSVTVKAGQTDKYFIGWSIRRGGEIVSADREYTFRACPDMAESFRPTEIHLYPNYKENRYFYDPNGGTVNTATPSMNGASVYYSVSQTDGKVRVTPSQEKYLDYCPAVYAFVNDGTFTREGYVLKEYNTKADGTGTPYSPGSMFYHLIEDADTFFTLYCIWEPAAPAEDFTYEDTTVSGKSGVRITGYTGSADTLAVPETLEGKNVIAIASGAFTDGTFSTLILPRTLLSVASGAFTRCSFRTLYFPNSITVVSNASFDETTTQNLHTFILTSVRALKYSGEWDAMAVKLGRILASEGDSRVIYVSGSSGFEGLSTPYMEALLGDYTFINFGTCRTVNGMFFLEGLSHYLTDADTVVYAPENSAMLFGETELSWKTFSVLHGMNNLFRYVDVSGYTNLFGAYKEDRSRSSAATYEDIIVTNVGTVNKWGDCVTGVSTGQRNLYSTDPGAARYIDSYYVTMDGWVMSNREGEWTSKTRSQRRAQYETEPKNEAWVNITEPYLVREMNRVIDLARATGAKVVFGFAPVSENALSDAAKTVVQMKKYENLIRATYHFDDVIGAAADHVYNNCYFYNCAFHLNNIGRPFHTYRTYADLCAFLGITPKTIYSEGKKFEGCYFEGSASGSPIYFLNSEELREYQKSLGY